MEGIYISSLRNSSVMYIILEFVDQRHLIRFQILCKKMYERFIPQTLKFVADMYEYPRFIRVTNQVIQIYTVGFPEIQHHIPQKSEGIQLDAFSSKYYDIKEQRFYVAGGKTIHSRKQFYTFEGRQSKNEMFKKLCDMPCGRYYMSILSKGDFFYGITGLEGQTRKPTNTCMRYQKSMDKWEIIPPLNQYKVEVGVALLRDYLYVFGGSYIQQFTFSCKRIERLNLKEMEKWEFIDILFIRSCQQPATVNLSDNKVLIFGGRSDSFGSEIYQFDHDKITMKRFRTDIPAEQDIIANQGQYSKKALQLRDNNSNPRHKTHTLYCFTPFSHSIHEYNIMKDTWTKDRKFLNSSNNNWK